MDSFSKLPNKVLGLISKIIALRQFSVQFQGLRFFNSLPPELTNIYRIDVYFQNQTKLVSV